ncbi:MAG: type IV toxin-antitoxin system AbiEi family antitoxin domain-containing protein [Acidimicrobiia bacterium]
MTARGIDEAISAIAGRQFGIFSRRQALACGATPSLVRRRLAAGLWIAVADGVYRLRDFPLSWHASLFTAVLATSGPAIVSHESAAALYRFPTFQPGRVVVTIRHGAGRQRRGVTVHQLDDVASEHVTTLERLPVTTAARTVIDLAAVCRRGRVGYVVEEALADEKVSIDQLCACFDAVARPGKPGVNTLRPLLAAHSPGYVPPGTKLERLLLRVLREGGLPRPHLEYPFPGRLPGEGRVDAAYPEERLIIEADSRRWHMRRRDFAEDRRRDNEATLAGWRTLRFTWADLTNEPAAVVAAVRAALDARLEA